MPFEIEPYRDDEEPERYRDEEEEHGEETEECHVSGKEKPENEMNSLFRDSPTTRMRRRASCDWPVLLPVIITSVMLLLVLTVPAWLHGKKKAAVQQRAQGALTKAKNGFADYNFTSPALVERFGYPKASTWQECTMATALQSVGNHRPLQFIVLGGSASAHSPGDCHYSGRGDDLLRYRWSSILKESLQQDLKVDISMVNVAQGDTTSEFNALTIDRRIDTSNIDILIIEFCINDYGGKESPKQRLELFFRRVWAHFQNSNRLPPPILNVCFWNQNIGDQPEKIKEKGLNSSALEAQWPVLDRYGTAGWNIQTINVGATINGTIVATNPHMLLQDKHHPNCAGVHFIANMVQRVIYQDLANPNCTSHTSSTTSTLPPVDNTTIPNHPVAHQVNKPNVRTASFSRWIPNIRPTGDMRMDNYADMEPLLKETGRYSNHRGDEKLSYSLPLCNESATLQFTLREPTMEWLGLAYHWYSRFDGPLAPVNATINDVSIPLVEGDERTKRCYRRMNRWIHLPDFVEEWPAESYTLSLCQPSHDKQSLYLHFLVGVMQET